MRPLPLLPRPAPPDVPALLSGVNLVNSQQFQAGEFHGIWLYIYVMSSVLSLPPLKARRTGSEIRKLSVAPLYLPPPLLRQVLVVVITTHGKRQTRGEAQEGLRAKRSTARLPHRSERVDEGFVLPLDGAIPRRFQDFGRDEPPSDVVVQQQLSRVVTLPERSVRCFQVRDLRSGGFGDQVGMVPLGRRSEGVLNLIPRGCGAGAGAGDPSADRRFRGIFGYVEQGMRPLQRDRIRLWPTKDHRRDSGMDLFLFVWIRYDTRHTRHAQASLRGS